MKLVILAVLFVLTGGAISSDYFKEKKLLIFFASLVAIISAYYLFSEIRKDIINEVKVKIKETNTSLNLLQDKPEIIVPVIEKSISIKSNLEHVIIINGLMWQEDPYIKSLTWENAVKYCSESSLGGYKDWHLPSEELLQYLKINKSKLTNPIQYHYWSATSDSHDEDKALSVNFEYGSDGSHYKSNFYSVRCVR